MFVYSFGPRDENELCFWVVMPPCDPECGVMRDVQSIPDRIKHKLYKLEIADGLPVLVPPAVVSSDSATADVSSPVSVASTQTLTEHVLERQDAFCVCSASTHP